jgi:hypothetical protein
MAVSIKLGTDVIWGSSTAGTSTLGKVVSCSSKSTAKKFEQMDENDELDSIIFHDQREEITFEVVSKSSGAEKPAPGSLVSIAGVTDALVMESEEKWASGDTKKFSITAMKSTA